MIRRPPRFTLFACTTLFRSLDEPCREQVVDVFLHVPTRRGKSLRHLLELLLDPGALREYGAHEPRNFLGEQRSEEHTSELQSLTNLVCRLLLEKKKTDTRTTVIDQCAMPSIALKSISPYD